MIKTNKKGQEEIIGFVLIVVIVAVVFLVFLGISINNSSPASQKDSGDVTQFLSSMMQYTTACAVTSDSAYLDVQNLLGECHSGSNCRTGESSCDVLNKSLREIIESNWLIGADRPVKGYSFKAVYNSSYAADADPVIAFSEGNCTAGRIGASFVFAQPPGVIVSSFEVCS